MDSGNEPKQHQVIYDYNDVPTLRRFALDNHRFRMAMGPFGSGKSSACVMEIIRRAHEQEPGPDGIRRSRWAVVRNSYGQLKDTTIRTFHDWYPPKLFGEYRITDHTFIITKFPGVHLEVLFRALDRPDQVANLLSLELTGAWFNEAREIPRAIIEAMDARINRYPSMRDGGATWTGIIMDTNPPDEDSYLYKMAEKVRPKTWAVFKQPSGLSAHAENLKNLKGGRAYYTNLAIGKDAMYIRVYIHGQYGYLAQGQPVFESYDDNFNVSPVMLDPLKGFPVYIGMDFSIVGCVIGQLTPFGQLRCTDEVTSEGLMGIRQFCANRLLPLLRTRYFGMPISGFGDPAGNNRTPTDESTCFDILWSKDVGLTNVLPADSNALAARIDPVEHFLTHTWKGDPGLLLSPHMKVLRKALAGGYHFEKEKHGNTEENKLVPAKNYSSHIADALEYLAMYVRSKNAIDKKEAAIIAQLQKRAPYQPACSATGY